MPVCAIVLLIFPSYLGYAVWRRPELFADDPVLFVFMTVVTILLAVSALLLFRNGYRTLQRLRVTADGNWELSPFVGEAVIRSPSGLEVHCIREFSTSQRFFWVLSLLSRVTDNYVVYDREAGVAYTANGQILGPCLRTLAAQIEKQL